MERRIARIERNKAWQKSKPISSSKFQIFWNQFREYCGHTALHGYQYLTEPGRHIIERLFWISVHGCALTGASLMIYVTWLRYESAPTVTAVESTHFPVWNLPFPAVTICDPNQVRISSAQRLAAQMSNGDKILEQELFEDMRYLRQLLKHGYVPSTNLSRLNSHLGKTGLSIETIMKQLSPSCLDLLAWCRWKGEVKPCASLFRSTKSDYGFCCSFNYATICKSSKNCNNTENSINSVPQRVTAAGQEYGLSVLLRYDPEQRYAATISTGAMRVLLHSWYEFPGQWAAAEALVRRHSLSVFRVTAESTYASEELRKLDVGKRGCVVIDDLTKMSKSRRFSVLEPASFYSQDNCLVDCRHEHILRLCGCHPYYYPNTGEGRFCDLSDIACLDQFKGLLSRLKPPENELLSDAEEAIKMECNCSPPCQELSYRYEATSGELLLDSFADVAENSNLDDASNYSLFNVFFGRMTGTRYRKDVLFSWDTLLSNAGGLFGLFMGFSLISTIEFMYFFTIRLFFSTRAEKQNAKKIQNIDVPPRFVRSCTCNPARFLKQPQISPAFPSIKIEQNCPSPIPKHYPHFLWAEIAPKRQRFNQYCNNY